MDYPDSASLQAAMEVPVTATLGSTGPLLRKLESLMASEHSWPEGVNEVEIQRLKHDLEVLCISMKDLSEAEDSSFVAKCWMKVVRELCFDTEDHLDEYIDSRAGAGAGAGAHESFSGLAARAVDAIGWRTRFDLAAKEIKTLLPREAAGRLGAGDSGVVGVEVPMDNIVNLLALDQKQLKVVSIFGYPGLGKTTVARSLYDQLQHGQRKYQCRAFVRVSRDPDMRKLLTSILTQIKAPRLGGYPDTQDLILHVNKHLQGKRYFIVLDDVWSAPVWDTVRRAFPNGDYYSRIITTTEIYDAALASCGYCSDTLYEMGPLNDDQSRKLFSERVFCPPEFKEVSDEIICKCGGLPLAIINVANLLASGSNLLMEEWKHVRDSLPSTLRTNPSDGMKEVINLVYNDLPPYLKTCLLYLNKYPEGDTIHKHDLARQLVAEGFVSTMEGQDLEETAEGYFDELLSREMVQPVDTNYDGEVFSCTVHHMVLDFIRFRSKEENFIITVDYLQSTLALPDKVRRLSVQFGGVKGAYIPENMVTTQVRSLTFWGFFKCLPSLTEYRLLQVMILHIWADEDNESVDLSTIHELFRLKYLKIECNISVKLPGQIHRLTHMGTLHVDARLLAVPSDIVYLERLLHLRLPSESILPEEVARMTSLRTLGYFDLTSNQNVLHLAQLTNLQDLQLTCSTVQPQAENLKKNVQLLGSVLEKLILLQSVTLVPSSESSCAASINIPSDGFSMVSPRSDMLLRRIELSRRCCIFLRLPEWFGELRKLGILKIPIRQLWKEDIDILKGLPSLTALTLYILKTDPTLSIVISNVGFQVLTYFKFVCPTPCLSFEQGAMPKVQKLNLCFNANNMGPHTLEDAGLHYLTCLRDISVKFGSRVADGFDITAAEYALEAALSSRSNTTIIRVERTDVILDGEEDKSAATEEKGDTTSINAQEIREGKRKNTESSEEHVNKQSAHSRYVRTDGISTHNTELVIGAMGSLLPKLLELVKDEYKLKKEVKSSVKSLYKDLVAMKAALEEVEKLEPNQRDKKLDIWAREVRDLSYDAEDVVDSLSVQVEDSHGGIEGLIPRVAELFSRGTAHLEISNVMDGILKQAQDLADRRKRYKVDDLVAVNRVATSIDPCLLASHKGPKELVGIEVSRSEVIRKLRHGAGDADKELKIVSIFGVGGLGKTTLAKSVYDKFEAEFVCRAFVPVSWNPDMKKVFMDILLEIDKPKYMNYNKAIFSEKQLIDEVQNELKNKRYLIVIDDIWDIHSWEIIKCALVDNNCGSRVVTTTRNLEVAAKAGDVYRLKTLSDKNSETLFNKRLFPGKEEVPSGLPEVSQRLLQQCCGVPFAIITMASLLAHKPRNDWSQMYGNIGFGSKSGENAYIVCTSKILLLSYYNLPYRLRACLLHLHIYPEDCLIKKETLIWKWVAEGFIIEKQGTGLFEVGHQYFMELINANVIIAVEDDSNRGMVIGCRVHDLVRDMIIFISTAENFVVVLDGNNNNLLSESKARRLAMQRRAPEQGNSLADTFQGKMRSFNATMCQFRTTLSLSRFKVLRVLAIEECTFTEVCAYRLQHIGRLIHLRYLGLYNTPIGELPDEIGDLNFLLTLDLRGTEVKILPRRFSRLTQLKCLRTDETITVPDWIGKLTSLEELRLDDVSKSEKFVEELGNLTELRELQIWIEKFDENSNKSLVESMGNLKKIQVLGLMSSMSGEEANWEGYVPPPQLRELSLTIASSRLPAWINVSLVPILSHLCVDVKAVEEQDIDILGALPELISLKWIMPSNVFPTIKGGPAFPKLRCFDTSAPFRFLPGEINTSGEVIPGAMQRVEYLRFKISVQALKRASFDFDFATMSNLPCLLTVEVEISCRGARANNSQEAEAAVKRAVDAHPESPILTIKKTDK